jgi:magnesium transporter
MRATLCDGFTAKVVSLEEALRAAQDSGKYAWIELNASEKAEVEVVAQALKIHPLTLEDLDHRNQRAKIEEFPNYLFLVLHWFAKIDTRSTPVELHCILTNHVLVTVVDGGVLPIIDGVQAQLMKGFGPGPVGADGIMYRLIDAVIDAHVPALNYFENRLERISQEVTTVPDPSRLAHKIVVARRALSRYRRALSPQRDVMSSLSKRAFPQISEKTAYFFRDVADHVAREYETLESLREFCQSLMELSLAFGERQQNLVVKRLTVLSTVFLPLNFLAGLFGTNFTTMPYDSVAFFCAGLSGMVALPVVLVIALRRKGWIA